MMTDAHTIARTLQEAIAGAERYDDEVDVVYLCWDGSVDVVRKPIQKVTDRYVYYPGICLWEDCYVDDENIEVVVVDDTTVVVKMYAAEELLNGNLEVIDWFRYYKLIDGVWMGVEYNSLPSPTRINYPADTPMVELPF